MGPRPWPVRSEAELPPPPSSPILP
jgi:hypothetical protein